jgi:hypothetical protein
MDYEVSYYVGKAWVWTMIYLITFEAYTANKRQEARWIK